MSSIASLGRAVSGLAASQLGLQVTGHNLSNMNTPGFTRQQLLQHESPYLNIGVNGQLQQVGLGVSISEIRQVRDAFVDRRFRVETSVLNFYQTKAAAVHEVEAILDEPHGETLSGMMEDFWKQTQKLSTNPSGVEERLAFIQTADVLMKRATQIFSGLETYQHHLNGEIKKSVSRINELTKQINDYNNEIAVKEINGDHANDLRDQRNVLLDELSEYMDITYSETRDGRVEVKSNGRNLIDGHFVIELETELIENGTGFVTPIWKDTKDPVFSMKNEINSTAGGDSGKLLGLLVARGEQTATIHTQWKDIALNDNKSVDYSGNSYMIPKIQKQLAELIDGIADRVNEVLSGKGIDGKEGIPVFVPAKGTSTRPLNEVELKNINTLSAGALKKMLLGLPKPVTVQNGTPQTAGYEAELGTRYNELLTTHKNMIDTFNTYLSTPATDPNYQTLKEAHERAAQAYETALGTYEELKGSAPAGVQLEEVESVPYKEAVERGNIQLHNLFSPENLQVNPELLKDGGYNHLGTVGGIPSDIGDNSLVMDLLHKWSTPVPWPRGNAGSDPTAPKFKEANFMDCYAEIVSGIGADGYEYQGKVGEKNTLVMNASNERLSMGGVSQDEELTNMLKYQYAYNASARMINMLDGMMDTIINRM